MPAIQWNKPGERFFEAGVDRGVLYVGSEDGVPWNGLLSVKDTPTGGESVSYYMEGRKYLNRSAPEEYQGGIEAYTYPDEFGVCDGTILTEHGFTIHQQKRSSFNLSYRTLVGNDIQSRDHAYKIHLIYNALATPSDRSSATVGETLDASTFSWGFTTLPIDLDGYLPVSHVSIDSRGLKPETLSYIEAYLYGSMSTSPQMPSPDELIALFQKDTAAWQIVANPETGLNSLIQGQYEDLSGSSDVGLYSPTTTTRLKPTQTPGLNTL